MVIEIISDKVPNLIGDQLDRPSNVRGKMGPICLVIDRNLNSGVAMYIILCL